MILFTILAVLAIFAIIVFGGSLLTTGLVGIIVFGDVFVAIWIIWMILKRIFK